MTGWRVMAEVETLSDHLYIEMSLPAAPSRIGPDSAADQRRRPAPPPAQEKAAVRDRGFPRWALSRLDANALAAAIVASAWAYGARTGVTTKTPRVPLPTSGSMRRRDPCGKISSECAIVRCLVRWGPPSNRGRRAAYWWSREIARLRAAAVAARRVLQRIRRRRRGTLCSLRLRGGRRAGGVPLRARRPRGGHPDGKGQDIGGDAGLPRGGPVGALISSGHEEAQTAGPSVDRIPGVRLRGLGGGLPLPDGEGEPPPAGSPPTRPGNRKNGAGGEEVGDVDAGELLRALRKMGAGRKAPGPDGS
ncbi:uncharacterized protein LOC118648782 [Monomorium pharaonis]|uniref:uncharacterized protein LOC118648782 n=1 Tax=Monomorium pharaonis TaxID=307658 RepID=UPI00174716A4|nr:uncharacterized protein LOC118648782 [Monomorium pharaonis]